MLVYLDEPLLITLFSQKTRIIALAVPDDDEQSTLYFATTVSRRDWSRYLEGALDLRYLYTFPDKRLSYTFRSSDVKDAKVMMRPFDRQAPEHYLPLPKFFSDNHTEEYFYEERPTNTQRLLIDGEWELTEFGQFNQKYSDIYAFSVSLNNWNNKNLPDGSRRKIKDAFLDRPFQGGFSYVHLFRDLSGNIGRTDQLSLDKIKYESPGHVDMFGKEEIFEEINGIIPHFLNNRPEILKFYNELHDYLSKNKYLKMAGDQYGTGDPSSRYISNRARNLAELMKAPDYVAVLELANRNVLVAAKVVLAYYRRLNEVASYFAQGRVSLD